MPDTLTPESPLDQARRLHAEVVRARREHAHAEYRMTCLLAKMRDTKLFRQLGYATIYDYSEVELDFPPRKTRELLRISATLDKLPETRAAFAAGDLGWTKVREITRVADSKTDSDWVERAKTTTSRDLEHQVRATAPGNPPPDPEQVLPPSRTRTFVFELEGPDAELLGRALREERLRLEATPDEVDDATILVSWARTALEPASPAEMSPADPPDAPKPAPLQAPRYQIAVQQCPDCRTMTHVGQTLSEDIAEAIACDAEEVDMRPGRHQERARRTIPPKTRRAVLLRHDHRCAVPQCRNTRFLDVHHILPRSVGGTHAPDNLVPLCDVHHALLHQGRIRQDWDHEGKLTWRRGDGLLIGQRETIDDLPERPPFTQQVLDHLAHGPKSRREIQIDLEVRNHWRVVHALEALEVAGLVLKSRYNHWYVRTDQLGAAMGEGLAA